VQHLLTPNAGRQLLPKAAAKRRLLAVSCTPLIMIEASPSAYPSGMLAVGKSRFTREGGDLRRFYTHPHTLSCGIDLHARALYGCLLRHDGEILLHRPMKAAPDPCLKAVGPSREGLVGAVEGLVTWYGLADLCAEQAIPLVLGHARSMKALHGGKANNDTSDSHKIAARRRGGMLPTADVYPAEMRAPRDLVRRRPHLLRTRAEHLSPGQNTNSQDNLPAIGKKIAYQANRQGVAERFHDPAVHQTIEVDLARLTSDDALLRDWELALLKTAKQHDAPTLSWPQTVPGIGKSLSLVLRSEIHDIGRFPSVQVFASDARVVTCSKASACKRLGPSGKNIGNAHLKWAFAEAATLFLRNNPNGQTLLTRLGKTHGTGKALTILAHTLARAVCDRLKRQTAFDVAIFLRAYRSRAGEPAVSRDTHGMILNPARGLSCLAASRNAQACIGPVSQSPCGGLDPRSGVDTCGVCAHKVGVCCPSPEPGPHGRARHAQPTC
jgi:transposase